MFPEKLKDNLKRTSFLEVSSCDFKGNPNVAPKFLLKIEKNSLYLIDYVMSRTYNNLKINPKTSIAIMDHESIKGYQINGSVEIIDAGVSFNNILKEISEKQVALSSQRIIEGIHRGQKHVNFEAAMPERFVVFKVTAEEVVEIEPSGQLKRSKV